MASSSITTVCVVWDTVCCWPYHVSLAGALYCEADYLRLFYSCGGCRKQMTADEQVCRVLSFAHCVCLSDCDVVALISSSLCLALPMHFRLRRDLSVVLRSSPTVLPLPATWCI